MKVDRFCSFIVKEVGSFLSVCMCIHLMICVCVCVCVFQIRLKEVFETPTQMFLVLELVTGGELFDRSAAHILEKIKVKVGANPSFQCVNGMCLSCILCHLFGGCGHVM